MDWVKLILAISLIIQEIQIILINKRLDATEDLIVAALADKIKSISIMSVDDNDKDKGD